jgi:hypothetical protein
LLLEVLRAVSGYLWVEVSQGGTTRAGADPELGAKEAYPAPDPAPGRGPLLAPLRSPAFIRSCSTSNDLKALALPEVSTIPLLVVG